MQRFISWDQWEQEYRIFRDVAMWRYNNDNKNQTSHEYSISIDDFMKKYGALTESPYPEIFTFLKTKYEIWTEADDEMAKIMYK